LIIIILTNFTGKSGAKNQGPPKIRMDIRKIQILPNAPPQVTGDPKSRGGGKE
jgi:hypothetical protein